MLPAPEGGRLIFPHLGVSFAPSRLLWLLRFGEEEGKMKSFYPGNDLGVGQRGSSDWLAVSEQRLVLCFLTR